MIAKRSLQQHQGQLLDQRRPGPDRRRCRSGRAASATATPTTTTTASSGRRSRRTPATASRCGSPAATSAAGGSTVSTEPFTYTVHDDIGGDVLILAAEDVTGLSPAQGLTSAQYADEYASSLDGRRVQQRRLRLRRHGPAGAAPPRRPVALRRGRLGDRQRHHPAARRARWAGRPPKAALDIELSVRDYLNEGGKLLVAGQVRAVRPGGQRCVLLQPVPAAGVHDAGGVPVPAGAQRLPAVLAGRLRQRQRRRHRPGLASRTR